VSWTEFDRRADGLAAALLDAGLAHQDKVAQYLYNGPEYMQSVYACFKAGMVPCNTNYRYADDELVYLWDNADAAAVMFHASFVPTIERIRTRLPRSSCGSAPTTGPTPGPTGRSTSTRRRGAGRGRRARAGTVGPSGADRWFLYTGGTTGWPKGVMWEQDTLVRLMTATNPVPLGDTAPWPSTAATSRPRPGRRPSSCRPAPLMHGTGHMMSLGQLTLGGCVT
jgi:acyl-CoA synthetase (AMP-forming)/AMP-acid ligase II